MRARARRSEGHRRRLAGDRDRSRAANTGTAAIASLRAVSPALNPNLTATITFTDDLGDYSYSLVDTHRRAADVNGTGTWTRGPADPAQRLGRSSLTGVPHSGDALGVQKTAFPAGDNGNAQCAARRCATRPSSAADLAPAASPPGRPSPTPMRPRSPTIGVRVQSARAVGRPVGEHRRRCQAGAAPTKSGVNLDEEAARLIQFQQSYQAAAKMLQVAQSLFDTLLQPSAYHETPPCASPPPTPTTPASTACMQPPGRARRRAGPADQRQAGRQGERRSGRRGARRARAGRASRAATPASARSTRARRDVADRERARRRRRAAAAGARALVAAGNASYNDAERRERRRQLRRSATQLFAIANRSDGAGTYLFGGQGATQKPFVDAPGGVQFAATGGADARPSRRPALPLTTDGRPPGCRPAPATACS